MKDVKNILLVDDNAISLKLLKWWCEKWGYTYDTCTSGEEALKKASKYRYDLYVLDVQLPDINGIELSNHLQGLNLTSPTIFQSGYSADLFRQELSDKDQFLMKPFLPQDLKEAIETAYHIKDSWRQTA